MTRGLQRHEGKHRGSARAMFATSLKASGPAKKKKCCRSSSRGPSRGSDGRGRSTFIAQLLSSSFRTKLCSPPLSKNAFPLPMRSFFPFRDERLEKLRF